MARAKQTRRAEARRRYRQAMSQQAEGEELELQDDEPEPEAPAKGRAPAGRAASGRSASARPAPAPQRPSRPGFGSAFREAYHPANVPEDLRALPRLLRHWSFFVPVGLIAAGAVIATTWWNYTGGQFAWQILLAPGTGFGLPQLIAGFFAPRASYMLGFLVSLVQGAVAVVFVLNLAAQLGTGFTEDQMPALLTQAFLAGPLSGTLFAAAAAWYRRFLALSSPRRAAAARAKEQARSGSKGGGAKR